MRIIKYIFVTGGVLSGLGKGVIASSIGKLLQQQGYSVTAIKIDPYINYDAGTMRPTEHGEVWVTDDGGEIDQDLGNYERFMNLTLTKDHNITTGKVFASVIEKERKGGYLGQTVQPIPHITNEIKDRIKEIGKRSLVDFVIIEIGGTVGDYENVLFLEAARQMKQEGERTIFVHVSYLPVPGHIGEMKTKPLQHSVKELQSLGIQPDFIIGRSKKAMDPVRQRKVSLFCNIKENRVISAPDVLTIYEIPVVLEQQHLAEKILHSFRMSYIADYAPFRKWKEFVEKIKSLENVVRIGIIGKYFDVGDFNLTDSYISVIEAVKHASWNNDVLPQIVWINSKDFETNPTKLKMLKDLDGIIIPGGFGKTGIEGKIMAIKYARERKIPFLGLCLGMQLSVVEFARTVCSLKNANSIEFDPNTKYPVVDVMFEQKDILEKEKYGATMRLGAHTAKLIPDTLVWKLYGGKPEVSERHRHRYEVNPKYTKLLEDKGLVFSGMSPNRQLMEFLEIPGQFFVATQAHPEFKSRPTLPAPLFDGFIKAALKKGGYKQQNLKKK